MKFTYRLILVVISCILAIMAFPLPDMWLLAWFCLVPALVATNNSGFWKGLLLGQIFGLGFIMGITRFLLIFGWEPFLFGGIYWALHFALFFGLWGWFSEKYAPARHWARLVVPPLLWVGLEWLKNQGIFGFAYGMLGLTQYDFSALAQLASVTGVFGISFFLVAFNTLVAETILGIIQRGKELGLEPWKNFKFFAFFGQIWTIKRDMLGQNANNKVLRYYLICFFALFFAVIAMGRFSIPYQVRFGAYEELGRKPVKVGLAQPNIPQNIKWEKETFIPTLKILSEQTEKMAGAGAEIVIWPETAIPHGDPLNDKKIKTFLTNTVRKNRIYLLTGLIERNGGEVYNAAVLLNQQGEVQDTFRKIQLVPMSEYLPLPEKFRQYKLFSRTSYYTPGKRATVFNARGVKFGTLICFESMFDFLGRKMVKNGAEFLVAITNNAWFLRTNMAKTHFIMGKFRAIENRVWFLQSANTGISGVVDPWGNVIQKTDIFEKVYLLNTVYTRNEKSFYTLYGNWFPVTCFILAFLFLFSSGKIDKLFQKFYKEKGRNWEEKLNQTFKTGRADDKE